MIIYIQRGMCTHVCVVKICLQDLEIIHIFPDFRVFRQILVRTFKITKEFAIVIHF